MASKRLKTHDGTEENQELTPTIFEDRISDLPDAIIHLILAYLPTIIAIRTSILSKRWRHLWKSIPVLDFCDSRETEYFRRPRNERNNERKKFFKFVDECLRHLYVDTTITKFKLEMDFFGAGGRIDGWLTLPLKKHVKELDLCVKARRYVNYSSPNAFLRLSTLTHLKLNGLDLDILFPFSLPSLEVLHLASIQMDDLLLLHFMVACPSLAKLCLIGCSGFFNPEVLSLSLKTVELQTGGAFCFCQKIKVQSLKLESFVYKGTYGRRGCYINVVPCCTIRNLSVAYACLSDHLLEALIPKLPLLESLNLEKCSGMKHFKIRNQHLRHLVFITNDFDRWGSLVAEAEIETPSLVSFRYAGKSMIKISLCAPKLLDVNIEIFGDGWKASDMAWYTNLLNFFSELNCSKNVQIFAAHEKALMIPEELREICSSPLPDLKHLKVKTGLPLFRKKMFRESLLWLSPSLDTLSIE